MRKLRQLSKPFICVVLALGLLASATACSASTPSVDISDTGAAQFTLPQVGTDLAGYGQAVVTDKEEVVYALLGFDGAVDNAYAINHFKLAEGGYLTDHGDYLTVSNLSNTYPLTLEGSNVALAAQKGDFYYQGDIKNPVLPWQIGITYSLDGKPVAAKDASTLAGKSGHLVIDLTTAPTVAAAADSSFYQNYNLQVSMTIDAAKSSNILAPDATIAAAGGDRQITFTVLPASQGSMHFEADVIDFEMPGIQIAAVPFSMSFATPDVSSLSGEMNTLVAAIRDLNNGVYELTDGAAALSGGASALAGGASEAAVGAAAFGEGLSQLDAGSAQISGGSTQFGQNLEQLATAAQALAPFMQDPTFAQLPPEVQQALGALIVGLPAASGGYTQLDAGIQAYTGGVSALASQYPQLAAGVAQLSDGVAQLNSGTTELASGTRKLASGTAELYGGVRDMPQTMQNKIDEFVANYDFSGFTPHSFLSVDNPKVSLVQLVIKTPNIELPSKEPTPNVPTEQTFWDRVMALFS